MSTTRKPCANHATGISVLVIFSTGWWQPVMYGCSSAGMSSIWYDANCVGCFLSVTSTTHRNADECGGQPGRRTTSSSHTTINSQPSILNGTFNAVCVVHGNGGVPTL